MKQTIYCLIFLCWSAILQAQYLFPEVPRQIIVNNRIWLNFELESVRVQTINGLNTSSNLTYILYKKGVPELIAYNFDFTKVAISTPARINWVTLNMQSAYGIAPLIIPTLEPQNSYLIIGQHERTKIKGFKLTKIDTNFILTDTLNYPEATDTLMNYPPNSSFGRGYLTLGINNYTSSINCSGVWYAISDQSSRLHLLKFSHNGKLLKHKVLDFDTATTIQSDNFAVFSANGVKIMFVLNNKIKVFDFDNVTGTLSNPKNFYFSAPRTSGYPNSAVFSPDNSKAYIATDGSPPESVLFQIDLLTSITSVLHRPSNIGSSMDFIEAPNQKIYVIENSGMPQDTFVGRYLHCISEPNQSGTLSGFNKFTLKLDGASTGNYAAYSPRMLRNFYGRTIPGFTKVCTGSKIQLQALANLHPTDSYRWSVPTLGITSTLPSWSISNIAPGTYPLVYHYNDCPMYDTLVVDAAPAPILQPSLTSCAGALVTLNPNTTARTFEWNTGATSPTIQVSTTGVYQVRASNICHSVLAQSIVTMLQTPNLTLPIIDTLCHGTSLILKSNETNSRYFWNTGDTTQSILVKQGGTYSLTAYNTCGSDTANTAIIEVYPPKAQILEPDTQICQGNYLSLHAATATGVRYRWNTGTESASLNTNTEGIYLLRAFNTCFEQYDTVNVHVLKPPIAPFGTDTVICGIPEISLSVPTINGTSTLWNTGETTSNIRIRQSGSYTAQVTNVCFEKTFPIQVQFRNTDAGFNNTNVLTPNGDGVNDTWNPLREPVTAYQLRITNRWGTSVFVSSNPTEAWQAHSVSDGVYFYQITYKNCLGALEDRRGWVQVLR